MEKKNRDDDIELTRYLFQRAFVETGVADTEAPGVPLGLSYRFGRKIDPHYFADMAGEQQFRIADPAAQGKYARVPAGAGSTEDAPDQVRP